MIARKRQHNRSLLDSDDEDEIFGKVEPAKKKSQSLPPGLNAAFVKKLADLMLHLDPTKDLDQPHRLSCEQGVFKEEFEKSLDPKSLSAQHLKFFEEQLIKYLEDDLFLLKALMPVLADSDSKQDPDSLIRIFLNIEPLQVNLANFLLEKFAILSHEDFHKSDPKAGLHRKILNSLRWLNFIVDGEQLTSKLMELLDGASDDVLIEIVVS